MEKERKPDCLKGRHFQLKSKYKFGKIWSCLETSKECWTIVTHNFQICIRIVCSFQWTTDQQKVYNYISAFKSFAFSFFPWYMLAFNTKYWNIKWNWQFRDLENEIKSTETWNWFRFEDTDVVIQGFGIEIRLTEYLSENSF